MMVRGIVRGIVEGVVKRFSASGMIDVDNREYIQHYGLTSRPKEGAEVVYLVEGNVVIALASDDRRYRLKIEDGEVALYDDQEQAVHLRRDGIVVTSPKRVTVDAPEINLGGEPAGLLALVDERILELINAHVHPGVKAGSDISAPMEVPILKEMVCTQAVKAE